MNAKTDGKAERESRMFWVIKEGGTVGYLKCLSCEPNSPGMWFCPEAGFSGSIGNHFFESRDQAFDRAIAKAEDAAGKARKLVADLRAAR